MGLAAIQIANMLGARPIALTRTSEKSEMLLKAGAAAVIATAEQDMVAEINRATDGAGAHIVFDPVGGPDVAKLTQVMAPQGMFFQYGALDSRDMLVPVFDILGKHLTLRGYELFEITTDPEKMARAKSFVMEGLRSGKLKPVIDKTFPLEEIADAQRYMEANGQVGKIVVVVD
ncbi:Phthiocerol synthesis polyketide synthase type I PpsC [compost metagenome]